MKKIIHSLFTAFVLALFLSSCSTDVNLYSDYKDITIVYGVLEYNADTNYVKITKAFLGPGNAYEIAQIPDSSNYPTKLDVRLKGRKNGIDLAEIVLDTITIKDKLPGDSIFYFPENLMYYTTTRLDPDASYRLEINKGDEMVSTTVELVNDFRIFKPQNSISFSTANGKIEFTSAVDAYRFEGNLIFNYKELHPGSTDTLHKSMSWYLGSVKSSSLTGGEQMVFEYTPTSFFTRLGGHLGSDTLLLNVKRFIGNVQLVVCAGGEELSTYIDVNSQSSSIIQEIPEYSNIENGYGIVSSRYTATKNLPISSLSQTDLTKKNWGFVIDVN